MDNKVVVITGASSGIGAALAEHLGRRGASLGLVARRYDALRATADRSGDRAFPIVADVTQRDDVHRVVEHAIGRFGHIDVWVNNAGQGITRQPSQLTDEDIDEMMRVNVKSVLYGMQEVLPHFNLAAPATSSTSPRCWAGCRSRRFDRRIAPRSITSTP